MALSFVGCWSCCPSTSATAPSRSAAAQRPRRWACSPRRTGRVMNSVPADQRGAGAGMRATFQNSGMVLSIGVFFSLMIAGLAELPAGHPVRPASTAQGVPAADAARIAELPPVGILFAAFLGYNPIAAAARAGARDAPAGAGRVPHRPQFFPQLITQPVLRRPHRRLLVRDRRVPGRGRRVVVHRHPQPPCPPARRWGCARVGTYWPANVTFGAAQRATPDVTFAAGGTRPGTLPGTLPSSGKPRPHPPSNLYRLRWAPTPQGPRRTAVTIVSAPSRSAHDGPA